MRWQCMRTHGVVEGDVLEVEGQGKQHTAQHLLTCAIKLCYVKSLVKIGHDDQIQGELYLV